MKILIRKRWIKGDFRCDEHAREINSGHTALQDGTRMEDLLPALELLEKGDWLRKLGGRRAIELASIVSKPVERLSAAAIHSCLHSTTYRTIANFALFRLTGTEVPMPLVTAVLP